MNAKSHDLTRTPDADLILLPEGLVGLPELKRWVLLENDPPLPSAGWPAWTARGSACR